jgi:hypothetical protein
VYVLRQDGIPQVITAMTPKEKLKRHLRKYAEGELGEDKSFYFRGPKKALNLRAQNLSTFVQLADGVDDETWLHQLCLAAPAAAEFFTYSQWRSWPEQQRAAYTAGAFDSLTTITPPDMRYADHYSECIVNAQMNIGQLTTNVSTFVDARPEWQGKPVTVGLVQYLIGLCGQPPQ